MGWFHKSQSCHKLLGLICNTWDWYYFVCVLSKNNTDDKWRHKRLFFLIFFLVISQGGALPLRSILPAEVVRYDEGVVLYKYDDENGDMDGGERSGGGGGGGGRTTIMGITRTEAGRTRSEGAGGGSGDNFWVDPRGWLKELGDRGRGHQARNKGLPWLSIMEGTGRALAAEEVAALSFDLRTAWQ